MHTNKDRYFCFLLILFIKFIEHKFIVKEYSLDNKFISKEYFYCIKEFLEI